VIALTLYSRPGCHLCDDMKALVGRIVDELAHAPAHAGQRVDVQEVDISSDPELEARFGLEIPVLLVNGKKAAKYRVTEGELRRRLADEWARLEEAG